MYVSIVFARALVAEVMRQGRDEQALLRHSQIDSARLSRLEETISLDEAQRLVEGAISTTSDAAIGLRCGVHAPMHMLQVIGHLLVSQSTIRAAFSVLQRYSDLLAHGLHWSLSVQGSWATLSCEPLLQLGDTTRCGMELAMVLAKRIVSRFVRTGYALSVVHFQHRAPSYRDLYSDLFACPVRFEQRSNALVFPSEYLGYRQWHDDSTMSSVAHQAAEQLLAQRAKLDSLTGKVRAMLLYQEDLSLIDCTRVAKQLRLPRRELSRTLRAEGTSLTKLLGEAKCKLACDQLRCGGTVKQISQRLGFTEVRTFYRAFHRWTGRTPAAYRRMQANPYEDAEALTASTSS